MSIILSARKQIETIIRNSLGDETLDLNYWGASMVITDPIKGVIWPTRVEAIGKRTEVDFKVALGIVAETPDALQESIGSVTGSLLGGCFSNTNSQAFGAFTGGACSFVEIPVFDDDGDEVGSKRLGAQISLGPMRVNDLEGFVEASRQSQLRGVKSSIAFVVTVTILN